MSYLYIIYRKIRSCTTKKGKIKNDKQRTSKSRENVKNKVIITITNEDGNSEIFVVLRKNFEDRYSISWEEI